MKAKTTKAKKVVKMDVRKLRDLGDNDLMVVLGGARPSGGGVVVDDGFSTNGSKLNF